MRAWVTAVAVSLLVGVASPYVLGQDDTAMPVVPVKDSPASGELEARLAHLESRLAPIPRDEDGASRALLASMAILVSGLSLIVIIVNVYFVVQGRNSLNDMKKEIRNYIEDFRHEEVRTKDSLTMTRSELDGVRVKLSELHEEFETAIADWHADGTHRIMRAIVSATDRFLEVFTDNVTARRLEVMRCKTFVELGDSAEKVRSLQYIGEMGGGDDVPFLDSIVADAELPADVRLAAQQAKVRIRETGG